MAAGAHIVVVGVGILIILAVVVLAGGQPVAEHLDDIFDRHPDPVHRLIPFGRIVDPVLEVVLVAAFVVQPGARVPLLLPFAVVGALMPVIIAHPDEEFRRGVLGKVVGQPLPVEADRETVF